LATHLETVADYVVTTIEDRTNNDVVALALRAAVIEANAAGGTQTILLPAWQINLTLSGTETYTNPTAMLNDLDITDDVTIVGMGAGLTIVDASGLTSGSQARLFDVQGTGNLNLTGVTLTGGDVDNGSGGAIYVRNNGDLTLSDSALVKNTAEYSGGAVYIESSANSAKIIGSVITDNTATLGSGGGLRSDMAGMEIGSTIVAKNSSGGSSGKDLYNGGAGTFTTLSNNRFTSIAGSTGIVNGQNGDVVDSDVDYVVTNLGDIFDHSNDSYALSLRGAVDLANQDSVKDTIWLPAWDFLLTREVSGTDDISVGDLEIERDVTIQGISTADSTIDNLVNSDAVFEEIGMAVLTLLDVDDNV